MVTTLDRTVTLHKVTDSMLVGDTVVDGPTGERTRQIGRIRDNTGVRSTPSTPCDWSISAQDLAAMDQPTYDVWHDLVRLL